LGASWMVQIRAHLNSSKVIKPSFGEIIISKVQVSS
jgi:hypothetical protein